MYFRFLEKSLEPQAGYEHHKRFLGWFEGMFLMEQMNEPARRDDLLDTLHKHGEELAENERVGGSLAWREWGTSGGERGQQDKEQNYSPEPQRGRDLPVGVKEYKHV